MNAAPAANVEPVARRLSALDRYLTLWIALAMAGGLALATLVPGLDDALDALSIGTISLPIALGLLLMMYPMMAKVRYEELGRLKGDRRLLGASLALNWIVGPLVMFALAWAFLPDEPAYRTGLIIIGLARCIAMVLVWNDLACGDREAGAVLVAINSLFQIVAYSLLGYFYLTLLPGWLGLDTQGLDVSVWEIARTVLIFLGIPLAAGYLTRRIGLRRRGREWYEAQFLPRIGPIGFWGLLFTILMLFVIQGEAVVDQPLDVLRIAAPLCVYFAVMFAVSFALGWRIGLPYPKTATLAFTAASNNFDLAIAVAIGVFGLGSGQALASIVGPLIEVPALVGLVYVSLWAARRYRVREPLAHVRRRSAARAVILPAAVVGAAVLALGAAVAADRRADRRAGLFAQADRSAARADAATGAAARRLAQDEAFLRAWERAPRAARPVSALAMPAYGNAAAQRASVERRRAASLAGRARAADRARGRLELLAILSGLGAALLAAAAAAGRGRTRPVTPADEPAPPGRNGSAPGAGHHDGVPSQSTGVAP